VSEQIVFVHGAWLTSESWENYLRWFADHGYGVSAPEWPRKHPGVEAQREDSGELAGLGVGEIVDHYAAIIDDLATPPILIGHSFGGLFVQLLLDRGLGRAGVAIDPASPKGVLRIAPSTLKSAGPAINHPSTRHGVVTLTPEQFDYGFTNTFERDAAKAVYEKYAVPETGRIFFEGGFANFSLHSPLEIDYKRDGRAPLLLVAGDQDHTIPAGTVKANFKKYKHSPSRTNYLEFAGRSHFHMVQDGWEEIATAIDAWLREVLAESPAATEGA
jgi:pimeloyl-ACP methyl ester carboxylesterase